ncbi:hypothetical protein UC8_12660 [Roseimaritima ulvae]|uniref:Uncharacterized protein n=1 Tax=Roseimaritima ulvae TaxID=980254 RepID=A0A5B9QN53_9BACT|nr:hypothetical protein UC8_12660 [Roseimaritima ulvae]
MIMRRFVTMSILVPAWMRLLTLTGDCPNV